MINEAEGMGDKKKSRLIITEEMISYTEKIQSLLNVNRTQTSPSDTQIGILGEIAFAQWFKGDWSWHDPTSRKGKIDFENKVEVKTSAFPYSEKLNLLVREDYAYSRKPEFYVQVIIDTKNDIKGSISQGSEMVLCGYATHEEVMKAPLKDFGSKFGGKGGYRCRFISVGDLHPMEDLRRHL